MLISYKGGVEISAVTCLLTGVVFPQF